MIKPSRAAVSTAAVILGVIVAVGIAATIFYVSSNSAPSVSTSSTTPSTSSTMPTNLSTSTSSISTTSSYCVYPGQPIGADVRILSGDGEPLSGANVTVVHGFDSSCGTNSGDVQTTASETFTTNNTEWYALDTFNGGNETITVTYDEQTYNVGMILGFGDYSCATLYIPSGAVDSGSSPTPCAITSSSSTTVTTYTTSQSSNSTAGTTVSTTCTVSAESTGFFLHLVEDVTNASIAGIQVTVTPVAECGQGSTESAMAMTYTTNASGWVIIPQPPLSSPYYLVYTFQYSDQTYSIDASWEPQHGTFTTVSLPSGQVTTSYEAPVSCNGTCEY